MTFCDSCDKKQFTFKIHISVKESQMDISVVSLNGAKSGILIAFKGVCPTLSTRDIAVLASQLLITVVYTLIRIDD